MGELPIVLDDSSLHEVGISRIFEKENGVYIDLDDLSKECGFVESNSRLRSLFDEAIRAFLSERSGGMCFRPVPVSCSDGRNVDLFKLFFVVRKIGGYDMVCNKYLWGFVVKHCGLASGATSFLKLIYVKYLKEFDKWLWDFNKGSNLDIQSETCRKLNLLVQELKPKFGELLMRKGLENKIESGVLQSVNDKNSKDAGLNKGGSLTHFLGSKERNSDDKYDDAKFPSENKKDSVTSRKRGYEEVINEVCVDVEHCLDANGRNASALEDSGFQVLAKSVRRDIPEVPKNSESDTNDVHNGFCALGIDNITLLVKNDLQQACVSQKLKRESFSFTTLLDWTRQVAKRSDDPGVGKIPKCSRFENHAWLFALVVRKARFLNRIPRSSNTTSQLQMKPWTDVPNAKMQTRKGHALCKECLGAHVQVTHCQHTEPEAKGKESGPKRNKESTEKTKGRARKDNQVLDGIEYRLSYKSKTHDIMIGSEYQAEVPKWTGNICESDSKWLGTRMWPPAEEKRESPLSLVPVGRGRQESSCDCEWKNSIECVRFHIAEKRFMLKIEFGSLFYKWRFDRMGEEVSLSWTPEEEDKFKEGVTSNATNLWKKMASMFPSKTREMLVSYYFNVYINQVRSYQNRTTPPDIDSDSEEQCRTVGERFGYRALEEAPNSFSQLCVENKQSFEFQ